ncbi:MAG TPA: hypothetical protein VK890_13745 [Bacteroidia bacterium]|jgi:hypothetical protein|nr:hypothetical protein [Bacteroidia bacterium]
MKPFFALVVLTFFSIICKGQTLDSIQIKKLLQGNWGVANECVFSIKDDSIYYTKVVYDFDNEIRPAKQYKFKISKLPSDSFSTIYDGTGFYLIETSSKEKICNAISEIDSNHVQLTFQKDVAVNYRKIH